MRCSSCTRTRLLWLQLVVACMLPLVTRSQGLRTGRIIAQRPQPNVAFFNLTITLGMGSPSCGDHRPIILVNGIFQPTLYAHVNDTIKIQINNLLPASLPQTSSGISIHVHGFSMWSDAAWADGTAYLTQCPVAPGGSHTYSFLADESPGTYFWHDHSAMNRANGLQGAFVLGLPLERPPVPTFSHGEHVLFISDWYNQEANVMAMRLNRPFDMNRVTNASGIFSFAGTPSAMLINGKGNQADCSDVKVHMGVKDPWNPPVCSVTSFAVPASNTSSGCSHEQFSVEAGKHYRFRLVNACTGQYVTVCFHNHTVEMMAADTTLVDNPTVSNGCVDINSGQRYDVNITMDQAPGLYWISVHTQYAAGTPSGYAVLRYAGAPAGQLPPGPTPQGEVEPWDADMESQVVTSDFVLGYSDNYDFESYYTLFRHRGLYDTGTLFYDLVPDKVVVFNMTQPLLGNGMLRWAMNNIAMPSSPPCTPILDSLMTDKTWLKHNTASKEVRQQVADSMALLQVAAYDNHTQARAKVYKGDTVPVLPVAGLHIIELKKDWVVDIVINNLHNSDMNGDYRQVVRNGSMQHPMHLHGHKYWVLGTGPGIYNHDRDFFTLNLRNPMLRDTATVPPASWMVLRLKANNPGIWPFHCHIMWHAYMGQQVVFAEALDHLPPRRQPGPACPASCLSSFAPFSSQWISGFLGNTRYQKP